MKKIEEYEFSYALLGNIGAYSATLKNTIKGIEVSKVGKTKYCSDEVVNDMLSMYKLPYSNYSVRDYDGRKKIKKDVDEQIKKMELDLNRLKFISKICSRKKSYFKDK
jgi:adenine-specific DNA methylase